MPGWCPTVHPVGPWRPILRETRGDGIGVTEVDLRTAVLDGEGRVAIRAVLDLPADVEAVVELDTHAAQLEQTAPNVVQGELHVPKAALWWPHTHGEPTLFPLTLRLNGTTCDLGSVGFRTIDTQHDDDGLGFAIAVNSVPVFCRGACWTSPDIVALPGDAAAYRPWLTAMRDAGMNMVRIGGTMLYEADDFHALCDELGLLVWQDAMLANFDYPTTEAFRASLAAELTQFLDRTQSNPSLAVFCGGSEVLQQVGNARRAGGQGGRVALHRIHPGHRERLRPDVDLCAQLAFGRRTARSSRMRAWRITTASAPICGRWTMRGVPMCASPRNAWRWRMCPMRASHGTPERRYNHRSTLEARRAARPRRRAGISRTSATTTWRPCSTSIPCSSAG